MKKDLVIISSHPNTELSVDVLKKCILSLSNKFDIALSTHCPVNEEIQKLINYYIFDFNNDIIHTDNNPIVWFKNEIFYLQIKHIKNHAYAAYSCMLNSLTFLQKKYEYFYCVNGDTIMSESDVDKLIFLKKHMIDNNKKCVFFKEFNGMVDSKIFFSNTKFFLTNIANIESKEDFIRYTENFQYPYVPYVLESFFCEKIDKYTESNTLIIHKSLTEYFSTSKIDILSSFNGKPEQKRDYNVYLVKEKTSNRIFFVYVNNNQSFENKKISITINEDSFVLNNGNYSFYKEINYNKECIHLQVENISNTYYVNDILTNLNTYIEFNS